MSEEIKELRYQIMIQKDNVTSDFTTTLINEIIKDEKIENLDSDDVNIVIHYILKLENKNFVVLFSLSSSNFDESNIELIENQLKDNEDLLCIIKLKDDESIKSVSQHRNEIFNLEMEVREILFIILQDSFPSIPWYKILQEIGISVSELKKFQYDREDVLKNRTQNELFFLLFSQYKTFDHPKPIKHDDLLELIKKTQDFDELKKEINERAITKTTHQDFLAKIGPNLGMMEDFRNDLAHSRFVDKSKLSNYDKALKNIQDAIKEFREKNNLKIENII